MPKKVEVKVNVNLNFDMTGDTTRSKDIYWQVRDAILGTIKAATLEHPDIQPPATEESDSPSIQVGSITYTKPRFSSTHEARVDAYRRISTVTTLINETRRPLVHKSLCESHQYVKKLDTILFEIKQILLSPDYELRDLNLNEELDKKDQ